MDSSIYDIPVLNLLLIFAPVAVVMAVYHRWSMGVGTPLYAAFRMVLQLVLVGFALTFIFAAEQPALICLVLSVMLLAAAWIALRPIAEQRRGLYGKVLLSLAAGTLPVLVMVIAGVIRLEPWFEPRYLIPLAGMIFSGAMNSLSLAAERFRSESERGTAYEPARRAAFGAALLPIINMFFAVGLVSLPGMMTGQILSGIHPLVAIRYQIMVMCMIFGAAGISSATYLKLLEPGRSV